MEFLVVFLINSLTIELQFLNELRENLMNITCVEYRTFSCSIYLLMNCVLCPINKHRVEGRIKFTNKIVENLLIEYL